VRHKQLRTAVSAIFVIVLSACQGGGGTASPSASPTIVQGGVAKFAMPPNTTPNYIFLMEPPQFNSNIWGQFVELMWMQLFFFIDKDGNPFVDYSRSIANQPTFSDDGKTATVTLKPWEWSDGTAITSRDVEFWMTMFRANKGSYGGYVPGQVPDNLTNVTYPDAQTITFTFDKKYDQTWVIYNQLGQLGVMPQHAWDKTSASGAIGDYDRTVSGAHAVWNFLNTQAQDLSTYTTNPLWKVIDGPWKLDSFDASTGHVVFVPNTAYSGPDEPTLDRFELMPYTTDTAEFNALRAGEIDYGYVPFQDISQIPYLNAHGYDVKPWFSFSNNYFVINFTNPKTGPIFKQLYVRQALQRMVNQDSYIKNILKGYGKPTYGPVPTTAKSDYVSDAEKTDPYPYSPAEAKNLLTSHGWTVNPNGVSTCSNPGTGANQCGAGIDSGAKLEFKIQFASGTLIASQEMQAFKSDASQVGIQIDLAEAPPNDVFAISVPCDPATHNGCNWDFVYWGGPGWTYGLTDTYPEQGQIFLTGAGGNAGGYNDPVNDQLILDSWASGVDALHKSNDYLAQNLPVIWMPLAPFQMSAISRKLHVTQGAAVIALPQGWYHTT
jgi:peptide/nickel transport system substrate-binding protein